jgi:2,4-dienoyl-CoA reductase-like NADH-dependent reductase (Old Yellow Enzyme family)
MPADLFAPLAFARGKPMGNRFALAPLTNLQSHEDGTLGEDEFRWLTLRAQGGFGLTMSCAAYVQRSGKGFPGQLGICSDAQLPGLARLAQAVTGAGSIGCVQLYHGGCRAERGLIGEQPVAPWADAETGARALGTGEVEQLVEDFVLAALRAERAGFEGVEVHGAHGYLLAQFLDAEHNRRDDRYGGNFANRSRVLFEIVDGIRRRTGPAFQLGVRLSPERFGVQLEESLELAARILQCGQVDYLDMSLWDAFKPPQAGGRDGAALIDLFAALPRAGTRLGVAGKIMDAATARRCLERGADFVLIGRGAILHHDFPLRVRADPDFRSIARPVSRAHLVGEGVGPTFLEYLASTWTGFVAPDP